MQRKTVSVLFCDVTGSTALGESIDPEALREVLARYFERMSGIVESHGGTVEKFIGGAFDGERDFARHDLIRIAHKESPYDAPVWIDIGNRDQLRPGATALAHELEADGADISFHVWPGEHNGRY
jgi:class 3 adenylate cyclase